MNEKKREILWAPWRMKYIKETVSEETSGCVFCNAVKENNDRKNLILYRLKYSFVILNKYPYNSGHLMIVPYRHVSSIEDLDECELLEISLAAKHIVRAIRKAMNPDGFNIGVNIGRAAGAGIDDHVHVHIVPRWNGDSNFMPVVGGVKVIPQSLDETYDELKPHIDEELEKMDLRGC